MERMGDTDRELGIEMGSFIWIGAVVAYLDRGREYG